MHEIRETPAPEPEPGTGGDGGDGGEGGGGEEPTGE